MDSSLKIIPRPVRQQVEDGLRDAIVSGRFAPGEHLPDRALCELFGTSRSVVREAVRLLEAEGLIIVHPNRGPFVATMSVAEATEIYEVRAALLDLKAAADQVDVAQSNVQLAAESLSQSRDRFTAGVTNTVEIVQAQQAVAVADETLIGAQFQYNVAKVSLARALGVADQSVRGYFNK